MLHTKTFYLTRLNKFGLYHKCGLMPLVSICYLRSKRVPSSWYNHSPSPNMQNNLKQEANVKRRKVSTETHTKFLIRYSKNYMRKPRQFYMNKMVFSFNKDLSKRNKSQKDTLTIKRIKSFSSWLQSYFIYKIIRLLLLEYFRTFFVIFISFCSKAWK